MTRNPRACRSAQVDGLGGSRWIWCSGTDPEGYNQTVLFRKEFTVRRRQEARLRIVADSWYRVRVNGVWIHDGPARAYPEELVYDEHDCTAALRRGKNRIEVIVRYFGCGTFHQIPRQGGLRAALQLEDGTVIGTDASWQAAPSPAWRRWTPKISIQMEPVEEYDARLADHLECRPSVELARPGVTLSPRGTGLLTRVPRRPVGSPQAVVTAAVRPREVVPVTRLAHPGVVEANHYTSRPVVLGAVLEVRRGGTYDFSGGPWAVAIDGRAVKPGRVKLRAGRHTVLFFCTAFYGHDKDVAFPWRHLPGATWGPWTVAVAGDFLFRGNDLRWMAFPDREARALEARWQRLIQRQSRAWKQPEQAWPWPADVREIPPDQLFLGDFAAEFAARRPRPRAKARLEGKKVFPSAAGDVELRFDFGRQVCGYFDFVLEADAGVTVDLNAVEYIAPDGAIQHTFPNNRNGLRYITKPGVNRFTSLKRRSGRYIFITLRNQKAPVEIKSLRIIESTAPVRAAAKFRCSDRVLEKAWSMSERTLQLCMEDTFTDCPLYEQTLWIGDARNEALYASTVYGTHDVSARGLELGAQSLGRFPLVGCQVPSAWECLLPAWSFLWGMHVWEHYFLGGDKAFLRKMWPAVVRNLEGAWQRIGPRGLFAGPFWNLLEWAPIDHDHEAVLHNSMLLASALRAGENCATVLGESSSATKYLRQRTKLTRAINRFWNPRSGSYPDALLDRTGAPSRKTCQHTSMLAIMCGVTTPEIARQALRNLLQPPRGMTRVASPFAMQFFYEALEEAGECDAIVDSIREKFGPMAAAGADTVWEMFPGADFETRGFPTRSHCHAWAASPLYFLHRIVLGVRPTVPGGRAFTVSPWINGLDSAAGATATPHGPVHVAWRRMRGKLVVDITAPRGVRVKLAGNRTHPPDVRVQVRQSE
jgi:alpha-L-rhamnosidase